MEKQAKYILAFEGGGYKSYVRSADLPLKTSMDKDRAFVFKSKEAYQDFLNDLKNESDYAFVMEMTPTLHIENVEE